MLLPISECLLPVHAHQYFRVNPECVKCRTFGFAYEEVVVPEAEVRPVRTCACAEMRRFRYVPDPTCLGLYCNTARLNEKWKKFLLPILQCLWVCINVSGSPETMNGPTPASHNEAAFFPFLCYGSGSQCTNSFWRKSKSLLKIFVRERRNNFLSRQPTPN